MFVNSLIGIKFHQWTKNYEIISLSRIVETEMNDPEIIHSNDYKFLIKLNPIK